MSEHSFTYPEIVVDKGLVAAEDFCVVKPPVTKKRGRLTVFDFANDVLEAKTFLQKTLGGQDA